MLVRSIILAILAFALFVLPSVAMPPQETQDVTFDPNPVPIHADCSATTPLTITGTSWGGHYKDRALAIYVEYYDGSLRDFGLVDPTGPQSNWQITIPVDCAMPQGDDMIHVIVWVHDTSWKTGRFEYTVPVVWV